MEVTELDGRVSPVPTAPSIVGSNRVAPAPVDLEQGGEQPPEGTDVGAELQLMQPPAGSTTASDQPHNGSMLASKSGLKSAQAAWLEIRHDATELPHAVRQKVRLALLLTSARNPARARRACPVAGALPVHVPRHRLRARAA